MARYLDPKNDLTFKRIFGEHPDLLIGFLNALMPLSPDRLIEEIEYISPEQVPVNPLKKNSIVDVKCRDKSGRIFIVEMQMLWTDDFMQRIVFNAGKAYIQQLDKSESYKLLQPVYSLAILNSNFDRLTDEFFHHYSIVNKKNTEEVIEGLEFVLIELEKFKPEKWADRKMAVLWLRFLKEVGENMRKLPDELADNEQILRAAVLCEEAAFTPEELEVYDKYWDMIRVEKTLREGSLAEGRAKGHAEGRAEGEAIGLAKGEAIGLAKGEAIGEWKKALLIARNLLKKGIPIEYIIDATGLTKQQIEDNTQE
jgi:conserved hypothetical protein (putative transposase or invertase)